MKSRRLPFVDIDDVDKLGFERGTTDEEPVDIRLSC